jgi:hypothetical protein
MLFLLLPKRKGARRAEKKKKILHILGPMAAGAYTNRAAGFTRY